MVGKSHETFVCIPFPHYVFNVFNVFSNEGNCREGTQKNHQFACPFPQMHERMERGLFLKLQLSLSFITLSLATDT